MRRLKSFPRWVLVSRREWRAVFWFMLILDLGLIACGIIGF